MPAQNRPAESTTPPPALEEEKADDSIKGNENESCELADNSCDSDGSSYSSGGEKDEFILVKLAEIRKEVQCPICLGIIRKTRTVMECLHRFCRECIDKSMRLGNNECPACRTHCASRRSLRDDPNYDALIAALYRDINKYEEEESAFLEEEKARNKQIQSSIAQTFRRQTEALGKKRTSARATAVAFTRRQNGNYQTRRNQKALQNQESDEEQEEDNNNDDDDMDDGSKDSSYADERSTEVKSKRYKRSLKGCDNNNESESKKALLGNSTEILGWGRGGMRSKTRNGEPTGGRGKFSGNNNRISKLINSLHSSNENNEASRISFMLVSLHEEKIPSLQRPYLCCSSTSSIKHLCQYVATRTSLEASEIEILIIKDFPPINNSSSVKNELHILHPSPDKLHLLNEHQILGDIHAIFTQQNLVLAYRQKAQGEGEGN